MALVPAPPPPNEESSHSDIVQISLPVDEDRFADSSLSPELVEEWQKNKPSYGRVHFMKHVLNNGLLADVTFLVKQDGNGKVEKLKAHKSILKRKSEFFSALFSDRWESDEVDLTNGDITSCDFKTFLEFLYLQQAKLTSENVMALYYMSNLYQIEDLKVKCETFLEGNIDQDNVLTLFKTVFLHDINKSSSLLHATVNFIRSNDKILLNKEGMLELNQHQLALIFNRGDIQTDPLKVLRFCLRWMVKERGRNKFRRFKELHDLFRYRINLVRDPYSRYLESLATWDEYEKPANPDEVHTIRRFRFRSGEPWTYRRRHADRISFRCTESILLTGIGLYGDFYFGKYPGASYGFMKRPRTETEEEPEPAKYNVDVRVHIHGRSDRELLCVFRRTGSDMNRSSGVYKTEFRPLYLVSDEWYTISVKINGPQSYHGQEGITGELIRCGNSPVVFEFQEADPNDEDAKLSNATGVPIGQIPELYFKLATSVDDDDDDVEVLE